MNAPPSDRAWITWETQRRNRTLSKHVGADLYEIDINAHRLVRYPISIFRTFTVLVRTRPKLLFVQNPSLILALFATIYGRVLGTIVVVDAHNAGLFPLEGSSRWLKKLTACAIRWAAITIVSNDGLKGYVERIGGTAVALPDPIPAFPRPSDVPKLAGKVNVMFVCSWAEDEPFHQVLAAATVLPPDIHIYMTGSKTKAESRIGSALPANVTLTGFLNEEEYLAMLHACDVVMVLTTREHCLVCGGYEAVAAEQPLVLSDTAALREYFRRGVLYTDNSADGIATTIRQAIQERSSLRHGVRQLKRELQDSFIESLATLEARLNTLRPETQAAATQSDSSNSQRQPV